MVGPGVMPLGTFGGVFSDETDIRPTILALAGLKDDYQHDGRVLFEALDNEAVPDSLRDRRDTRAFQDAHASRLTSRTKFSRSDTGRTRGTDGSNPAPSSGQSVSRGIFPSYVEKPGFSRGCAGRSR